MPWRWSEAPGGMWLKFRLELMCPSPLPNIFHFPSPLIVIANIDLSNFAAPYSSVISLSACDKYKKSEIRKNREGKKIKIRQSKNQFPFDVSACLSSVFILIILSEKPFCIQEKIIEQKLTKRNSFWSSKGFNPDNLKQKMLLMNTNKAANKHELKSISFAFPSSYHNSKDLSAWTNKSETKIYLLSSLCAILITQHTRRGKVSRALIWIQLCQWINMRNPEKA